MEISVENFHVDIGANYTVQLVIMDSSKYRQFIQSGYEPPTFVVTTSL